MDINNAQPVNGGVKDDVAQVTPDDTLENVVPVNAPAPTTAERQAAKAEADKVAEKAAADEAAKKDEAEAGEQEDDEGEKELDKEVWGDAGNEVANSVLTTLQNSGVTPEEAKAMLWDAVENGTPENIDRDALVEKVGKSAATLIMTGINNIVRDNKDRVEAAMAVATKAAGSKENWSKATKWANAKMDAKDLDEYRGMIDKGGKAAEFAAAEIVKAYNADASNTSLDAGKSLLKGDSKATTKVEPMNRREYGNELMRLNRKGGTPAEFAALNARRKAGKKAGI